MSLRASFSSPLVLTEPKKLPSGGHQSSNNSISARSTNTSSSKSYLRHKNDFKTSKERKILIQESVSSWLDDAFLELSTSVEKHKDEEVKLEETEEEEDIGPRCDLSDVDEDDDDEYEYEEVIEEEDETDDDSDASGFEMNLPPGTNVSPLTWRQSFFRRLSTASTGLSLPMSIPFTSFE